MKIAIVSLLILICTATMGCKQSTPTAPADSAPAGGTDTHDHSHDHGPHGGHVVHLEPTGNHAEWTHDDDVHLITVFLDDFDAANVASVKFIAKIGDQTEEFQLASGDGNWSITSQELLTHINMKEAAEVNLVVVDDSGVHTAKIEAHDHHHH